MWAAARRAGGVRIHGTAVTSWIRPGSAARRRRAGSRRCRGSRRWARRAPARRCSPCPAPTAAPSRTRIAVTPASASVMRAASEGERAVLQDRPVRVSRRMTAAGKTAVTAPVPGQLRGGGATLLTHRDAGSGAGERLDERDDGPAGAGDGPMRTAEGTNRQRKRHALVAINMKSTTRRLVSGVHGMSERLAPAGKDGQGPPRHLRGPVMSPQQPGWERAGEGPGAIVRYAGTGAQSLALAAWPLASAARRRGRRRVAEVNPPCGSARRTWLPRPPGSRRLPHRGPSPSSSGPRWARRGSGRGR